jgi:hypothetical protein
MPFPGIAAAKAIPWADVIAAAPGLARGARDLWKRVQTRETPAEAADTPEARIAALEQKTGALAREAEQRSELVARLAEQNEQLIATLERERRRTTLALLLAALALLGLLAMVLVR